MGSARRGSNPLAVACKVALHADKTGCVAERHARLRRREAQRQERREEEEEGEGEGGGEQEDEEEQEEEEEQAGKQVGR